MAANLIAQSVLLFFLLVAAALCDLRKREIPDTISVLIALAGLLNVSPANFLGILPALLLLWIATYVPNGIGGGDIKFCAATGFAYGIYDSITAYAVAIALLVIYATLQKVTQVKPKRGQHTAVPVVPFLSIGYIAATIIEIIGGTTL